MSEDPDDEYNFEHWGAHIREDFRASPAAGTEAPDFTVTRLDNGDQAQMSDFWAERDVLMEFGSRT